MVAVGKIWGVCSLMAARAGLVPLALVLALLTTPASFAQGLTPGTTMPVMDNPGEGLPGLAAQNQSTSDPQPGAHAADSTAKADKDRLAVNPVTGLVTSSASNYDPLTGPERWKVYWKMNFYSVGAYFGPVFTAAVLDQTTNSPPQWGPNISGYGLRVASRTVSGMVQGTVQAPLAALLHEDVRYISSSQRGFGRRTLHAILYSVLTYNEQGRPTPNIANLTGYYASTAISSAWLPGKRSLAGYTFSNGTEQVALSIPVNILQEFWPNITHWVLHRHSA